MNVGKTLHPCESLRLERCCTGPCLGGRQGRSTPGTRAGTGLLILAGCLLALQALTARELGELTLPGNPRAELLSAATGTMIVPEGEPAATTTRLRLGLLTDWERVRLDAAVDLQGQHLGSRGPLNAGFASIPGMREAYRIRPLNRDLGDTGDMDWRAELDRAALDIDLATGLRLKLGRQAIGLGRGVVFSAIDVFAPFSPVDIDREWRRGVDAMRLELGLGPSWSVEAIAVGGPTWHDSAALARVRGHSSRADAELVLGKRRRDTMVGVAVSAPIGGAEVHAEGAAYETGHDQEQGSLTSRRWVLQTVIGGSYTLDLGNGLTVLVEHHGNGFGDETIADGLKRLIVSPDYQNRFAHGDTRILGRQAAAIQVSYPLSLEWNAAMRWIINPDDGSGLVTPYLSWAPGERVAVLFSVTVPHGSASTDRWGIPDTEYGGSSLSAFLQVRIYD